MSTHFYKLVLILDCDNNTNTIDGSGSKTCISKGRQCKTVPISGLHILVQPNQKWMFPLNDITKVTKCTNYGIKVCNYLEFVICFQHFKFSFCYMCCQVRLSLQSVAAKAWQIYTTYRYKSLTPGLPTYP